MLTDLFHRLRAVFRRNTVETELDDELRFHVERESEKRMASGLPHDEALRRARLAFGGIDQIKEECRQARGVAAVEITVKDLRYAIRGMGRNPVFTIAAVLTLGLGAAAISTVLTLAHALFFRDPPVERPEEVVVVQATRRQGTAPGWVGYPDYAHFRDQAKTLEGLAAHYSTAPLFVAANNQSKEINGAVVSANFFPLLGISPALGRFFVSDEDSAPDRDPVAVVGYELWRRWFDASPEALGARIKINGAVFTVIGVAPRGFQGVTIQPAQIYIPTMMLRVGYRWCDDALASDCTILSMIGRLKDGRTVEEARAEISTLVPSSWAAADEGENTGVTVFRPKGALHPDLTRRSARRLVGLLAGVAGVLALVCCANLSGLLIARNSARVREFAIRASLGAGRGRLIRQLLTESLLLAACGGATGLLLSLALTAALRSMFYSFDAQGHPLRFDFTITPGVILATVVLSVGAGLLFGVIPALWSSRANAAESLARRSSTSGANSRLGRWLVGAQTAVAVSLIAVAGLLTMSASARLNGTNYEASHVALMRLRPRLIEYPPEKAQQFVRAATEQLESLPEVESLSMVGNGVVLLGGGARVALPAWEDPRALACGRIEIGPRYFETLRTPLLRGREFDDRDTLRSPAVAIVNETLARRLWPAGSVVGAALTVNGRSHRVVGVVSDVPLQSRDKPSEPYVYTPYWQNAEQVDARLCIRVTGDPVGMLPTLVREVNRVDPDVPVAETIPLLLQIAGSLRSLRMSAGFVSYAAGLAVLLCAIGLYGALTFAVAARTREIGIRLAVGASSNDVLAMIVREGMIVVLVGVTAGLGLAFVGARAVRHLLYGPGQLDGLVYAAAALLIAGVGLFACWVPARRAAGLEPVGALRAE